MAIELKELLDKLSHAHGSELKSIVLYGEAVEGEQLNEDAPKKVLVVLKEITPHTLRAGQAVAEWWRKEGNPLPVYFSAEEIADSTDVFPIEFLDMSRIRHVLYGQDPFANLQIDTQNLRHQLEYELRGKLIRLRSIYVSAANNPNRLARLMSDSLDSFVTLFRHVLELLGSDAPLEKNATLIRIADELKLDKKVFARLAEYAADEEVWLEAETNETFGAYLKLLERVIQTVDEQA
ncbi:MAG: hypothetical protein HY231_06565 [Acidobacteria bacterium]|nr:hypothetical protein [Acidobacteriota bacterium]